MIDAILQNESRVAPTPNDLVRWAEGRLPSYGISSWSSGNLDFPVVGDGDAKIWEQYWPGSGYLPTNVIIGPDFVIDYFEPGWGADLTDAARCCIEKNICEMTPPGFVFPASGTRCDDPFDCKVQDGATWRDVCTD